MQNVNLFWSAINDIIII